MRSYRYKPSLSGGLKVWQAFALMAGILIAMPVGCAVLNGFAYSDGTRTAKLIKVSKKGILWKTWEGQLAMFTTGEGGAMQPYEFSIPNEALAKRLAACEGKTVRITYDERLAPLFPKGSTAVYVTDFTVID